MRGVLDRMGRAKHPALYTLTPAQAKAAYELGANVLEVPRADLPRVQDFTLPARDGHAMPARLYAPSSNTALPVLLYLHGGGFVVGSIASHDLLCRELARLSGCMVVSLDYRLAPEHRFPQAVEDAWNALSWLAAHGASLGADTARIAIGGDSAGGTLSAVCALMARDAGLPLALQLLFYPGCAPQPDSGSHTRYARGLILERPLLDFFMQNYLRSEADRADWRFAPLLAEHLDGVAPAWLGLAECDPLFDEGVQYADRLRLSGVATDIEVYRGVTHEFIKMGRALPEAAKAHADAARALQLLTRNASCKSSVNRP